jgi:hypothetical protein
MWAAVTADATAIAGADAACVAAASPLLLLLLPPQALC